MELKNNKLALDETIVAGVEALEGALRKAAEQDVALKEEAKAISNDSLKTESEAIKKEELGVVKQSEQFPIDIPKGEGQGQNAKMQNNWPLSAASRLAIASKLLKLARELASEESAPAQD